MARRQIILGAGPIVPPLPVPPLPPPEQPSPAAVRKQIEDAIQEQPNPAEGNQGPACCGVVIQAYDASENTWTDAETDGEFAAYCSAHPCGVDYMTGGWWVKEDVTIYVEFPYAPQISGTHSGVTPGYECTGVTQCPAGTRVVYLPNRHYREWLSDGLIMDGFEIGWLRMLPWALKSEGVAGPILPLWNANWGAINWQLVHGLALGTPDTSLVLKYRNAHVDPCGRVVYRSAPNNGQGISGWIDKADLGLGLEGHVVIHFDSPG